MVKVAGVRFKTAGKVYYFDPDQIEVKTGDNVIVETARGMEFGTVTMDKMCIRDRPNTCKSSEKFLNEASVDFRNGKRRTGE